MRAALAACVVSASVVLGMAAQATDVRVRVFDAVARRETTPETLLAAMVRADVVFMGEDPSDVASPRVEQQLLERLSELRGDVFLLLEPLARDAQEPLDHFQMGHLDDRELTADARLDPAVFARYKPIVDQAVAAKWPIIAGSLPARLAADVTAAGLDTFRATHGDDAPLFARAWVCPATESRARQAICLAEETMAESIASTWTVASLGNTPPVVVSLNDHARIDSRRGVVERTARRLPGRTLVTVQIAPVASLEGPGPGANGPVPADYVIWVARAAN